MKTIKDRIDRFVKAADLSSPVNRLITIEVADMMPPRPMLHYERAEERMDWAYRRYAAQCELVDKLQDDNIPRLSMLTGTEIFAEAFGCKVFYPENNNPFAVPFVHSAEEAARIKVPRLEDTRLPLLFDMADRLWERTGKEAIFSLPDIQSPMDIAALIWDKADLFIAMYEEPEAVKELAAKTRELLTTFMDEWFRRYGKAFWAHFPEYYMADGITLSEDEIGSVSPDMFEEFFAPELDYLSERYGGIGIHCCADSKHQWAGFAKVKGLRFINICQPPEVTRKSIEYFKGTCVQVPWYADPPQPKDAHIIKNLSAPNLDEAKRILEREAEKDYYDL